MTAPAPGRVAGRVTRRRERDRLARVVAVLAVAVLLAGFLAMIALGVQIGTT